MRKRFLLGASVALVVMLLPMRVWAQDVTEYYGVDALGSVRVVFDSAGNLVNRMDYGPFGEQLAGSTFGRRVYAQLFRDGESALDYANARMYQPRSGRFSAPDPVNPSVQNPQGWNRYAYALNSPFTFTDPSGLQAESGTRTSPFRFCGAENSFERCGGDDLFWNSSGGGGFEFGDSYAWAQDIGYTPGMSSDLWQGLLDFTSRAQAAFDSWIQSRREQASTSSRIVVFVKPRRRTSRDSTLVMCNWPLLPRQPPRLPS